MQTKTSRYEPTLTYETIKSRALSDLNLAGDNPRHLYRPLIDDIEKAYFEVIIKETGGNQSKAAIWLGMNRATLVSKLKRHGISRPTLQKGR